MKTIGVIVKPVWRTLLFTHLFTAVLFVIVFVFLSPGCTSQRERIRQNLDTIDKIMTEYFPRIKELDTGPGAWRDTVLNDPRLQQLIHAPDFWFLKLAQPGMEWENPEPPNYDTLILRGSVKPVFFHMQDAYPRSEFANGYSSLLAGTGEQIRLDARKFWFKDADAKNTGSAGFLFYETSIGYRIVLQVGFLFSP